ncbi:hypothetical protein Ancab_007875 [Ancistrocladus abbreviatus]
MEMVTVHTREVIRDERHGVQHLNGARGRHGNGHVTINKFAGGDAIAEIDCLLFGEEGIAHLHCEFLFDIVKGFSSFHHHGLSKGRGNEKATFVLGDLLVEEKGRGKKERIEVVMAAR